MLIVTRFFALLAFAAITACSNIATQVGVGDAIAVSGQFELVVEAAPARKVPVTVFHPAQSGTYPLIAFSHGAYAAPGRYEAMLEPIAAAGYIVVAPMHVDSEEIGLAEVPKPPEQWRTRNEDMALALAAPVSIRRALHERGFAIASGAKAAMGHSYGALMAQLPGGARAKGPGEEVLSIRDPAVVAVVVWSPPKAFPGMFGAETWEFMETATLTITGTADVLSGFIDDWREHLDSYEATPAGDRWLWVGEGVDHYFNGTFGRVNPVPPEIEPRFDHAIATSIAFLDQHVKSAPSRSGQSPVGVTLTKDQP